MADIDVNDAQSYCDLIHISISDVQNLLKDDVDIKNNQVILTHLCAAVCFYKYTLLNSINEPINIKKLNVSISQNNDSKIKNALMIKNEALVSARHLLKDNDFFFEGVI